MSTTPATKPKPKPKRRPSATVQVVQGQAVWQERWFHLVMWLALFCVVMLFLDAVKPILLPFVLGAIVAYLMDPAADWMERHGVHRGMAAALITVLLFAAVAGLIVWLGPLLYHQMVELAAKVPHLIREVELGLREETAPLFRTLNRLSGDQAVPGNIGELMQRGVAATSVIVGGVLASAASVLNVMALLLITPIVCFYFIRDWTGVLTKSDTLLPRAYAPTIREQLTRINQTLAAYLRGQLTVMLLLAVFYSVAFSILTLKYAILLGLLAGLLVIIPYIGTWVALILGMAVAYSQFGVTTPFWIMLGVYGVGQVLESQVLVPKIVGDQVGVHPLWLLFGMLAGGVLLGFVGVLLAVPLTAVISVLVKFVIERYLQSSLYTDA